MYLFKHIASIHKKRKKKKKGGGLWLGPSCLLLWPFTSKRLPWVPQKQEMSSHKQIYNAVPVKALFLFFLFFLHLKFWKNFRLQTMSRNIQYFILTDILQSTSSYSCLTWANPNACTALFDVYTSLSNCFIY